MNIETNPERVKELASQKEDKNWDFRTFLKGIDLSTEELDAIVDRHYHEVSQHIDCCACGNCCKTLLPDLSPDDMEHLAGALGLSRDDLIKQHLTRAEERRQYTFKSTPCPFLSENRCTVYDARPDACRSYPHLHKKGFVHRLIGVVQNCSICPIVFNVLERLKEDLWHPWGHTWMDEEWAEQLDSLDE